MNRNDGDVGTTAFNVDTLAGEKSGVSVGEESHVQFDVPHTSRLLQFVEGFVKPSAIGISITIEF
jgi:hypothetical protein